MDLLFIAGWWEHMPLIQVHERERQGQVDLQVRGQPGLHSDF